MTKKAPDLATASTRELLVYLIRDIVPIIVRTDKNVADLTQALDDLTASVDAIGVRFNDLITPLQQALADSQQALADLQVSDDATKQALTDSLAAAQTAADAVEEQVTELNQIGTPPATP